MKGTKITSIAEHLNSSNRKVLEYLTEQEDAGMLDGFIVTAKIKGQPEYATFTGNFRKDPYSGIGPIGKLFDILSKAIKERGDRY